MYVRYLYVLYNHGNKIDLCFILYKENLET